MSILDDLYSYLPMPPDELSIGGTSCRPLTVHRDSRGCLFELIKEAIPSQEPYAIPQMCYCSRTEPGCARDKDTWHWHRVQTDRFVVLAGIAAFGLSDWHKTERVILQGGTPVMLTVPPNVLHCYHNMGWEPLLVINFPTELYDPDDERRVQFSVVETEPPWEYPKCEC
mgnify:FL=1